MQLVSTALRATKETGTVALISAVTTAPSMVAIILTA